MSDPIFKAGDLVELKSGGPVMTVERVGETISGAFNGSYTCTWFAGAKHNIHAFQEAALAAACVNDA